MLTRETHVAGSCLAVALVAVLVAPAADASPIIFTDRAAFATAVQPNALVTFDTVEPVFWGDPPSVSRFRSYCGGPVAGECKATIDGILSIDSSDSAAVLILSVGISSWEKVPAPFFRWRAGPNLRPSVLMSPRRRRRC